MKEILSNKNITLTVDSYGAEVVSAVYGGRERIWQNDNGSWTGHSPVLFPVCGHVAVIKSGKEYSLPSHGFARRSEFTLQEKGADFVRYVLKSNEKTHETYPYDFELTVSYRLTEKGYQTEYRVKNPADTPLYFSAGGHPSFALEKSLGNYKLLFEQEEELVHNCHDEGGYLTGEQKSFGSGYLFPVPEDYLQEGRTLIFANVRSKRVSILNEVNLPVAAVASEGFPHLLVWRPKGAQMLCVEPWGNLPDKCGDRTEFDKKPGLFELKEGEEKVFSIEIFYE